MCLLTFNEVAKPGLVANQDDRARKVVFWWAALKCGSRSPLAAKLQRRQTHKQLVWKVQQEQLFVAKHWAGGWVQPDRRCCNCSVCNNEAAAEEQEPGEGPRDCGSTGSNTFFQPEGPEAAPSLNFTVLHFTPLAPAWQLILCWLVDWKMFFVVAKVTHQNYFSLEDYLFAKIYRGYYSKRCVQKYDIDYR